MKVSNHVLAASGCLHFSTLDEHQSFYEKTTSQQSTSGGQARPFLNITHASDRLLQETAYKHVVLMPYSGS